MPLSKRNRRGILFLVLFAVIGAYIPRTLSFLSEPDELVYSHTQLIEEHNKFVEQKEEKKERKEQDKITTPKYRVPHCAFDPNQYTLNDWVSLGLSEKQALVVLKFAERGLKSNKDLQKIFVFPKELFELVKDSTFYTKTDLEVSFDKVEEGEEKHPVLVDLNLATQEELETLPGIGPFYAVKIIEYRGELGGFADKTQLLELWKFDKERLEKIIPLTSVEQREIRKIDINSATLEELKRHPYVDYSIANSIVKMRKQKKYTTIEDLSRSVLIDQELLTKLKPYLIVK